MERKTGMRDLISLRSCVLGFVLAAGMGYAAPSIPPLKADVALATKPGKETAVFAGGCFWGVQSVFQRVKGVQHTIAGYSGGDAATANYRAVCSEETGHAEAIEIVYDPSLVSYGTL